MVRLLIFTAILTACGSSGGGGGGSTQTIAGALSFASESELPECNDSNKSVMVYVRDTASFKYCEDGQWRAADVTGKAGANCYDGLTDQNGDSKVDVKDCVPTSDVAASYEYDIPDTDLCDDSAVCKLVWARLDVYKDGAGKLQVMFYNSVHALGTTHVFKEVYLPKDSEGADILLSSSVNRTGKVGTNLYLRILAGPYTKFSYIWPTHDDNNDNILAEDDLQELKPK